MIEKLLKIDPQIKKRTLQALQLIYGQAREKELIGCQ